MELAIVNCGMINIYRKLYYYIVPMMEKMRSHVKLIDQLSPFVAACGYVPVAAHPSFDTIVSARDVPRIGLSRSLPLLLLR
jgi:hypothetical protein